MTRAQLLALADAADKAVMAAVEEGNREEALKKQREAELWREMARLTKEPPARTLIGNMAQPQVEVRRRGRPTRSKHPFPVALGAKTVAEWAREHDQERETVKSWFATGKAGRSIPEFWAKLIEREYPTVKANETVWRNGIRRS